MKIENINKRPVNILPWIKDGSYKTAEYQKKIADTLLIVRGTAKPGTVLWDLNNKTVI